MRQSYHATLNAQAESIAILRVENGWVLRDDSRCRDGEITPLRVAETPEALIAIIRRWAESQTALVTHHDTTAEVANAVRKRIEENTP